jgi:hypothetical protein
MIFDSFKQAILAAFDQQHPGVSAVIGKLCASMPWSQIMACLITALTQYSPALGTFAGYLESFIRQQIANEKGAAV